MLVILLYNITEDYAKSTLISENLGKKRKQGLEIMFAVLQSLWKHHKSKERDFLKGSYTLIFFQLPQKIFFRARQKNILEIAGNLSMKITQNPQGNTLIHPAWIEEIHIFRSPEKSLQG